MANDAIRIHLVQAARAMTLPAGRAVALLVCLSGCGGGADRGPPPTAVLPIQPPAVAEPLIVGAAQSIDNGADGDPVSLRVARSANGDGFAVWRADNGKMVPGGGSRHDLWANRYSAIKATWGSPIRLRAGGADIHIPDFDLAVDGSGGATISWTELIEGGPETASRVVVSSRFDAGIGVWDAPVQLNANAGTPRLASDATGAVLAVYGVAVGIPNVDLVGRIRGRFFDTVTGNWLQEVAIDRDFGSNGYQLASLDGSGNALTVFSGSEGTRANYYSRSVGTWGKLVSGETVPDKVIPGSTALRLDSLQLAASTEGNFLLGWDSFSGVSSVDPLHPNEIRIARFTSRTGTWSAAQTVVPATLNPPNFNQLLRMGSDAAGIAMVLLTQLENGGSFAALKAIRVDDGGVPCSGVDKIDHAVGGVVARADLGVDPQGNAIAIWQLFEGSRPDDGSRSNIAINRFDVTTGRWAGAVLAETQPGNAISPSASVPVAGQALLGWIQSEGGVNRVKALLQPMTNTPGL